MKPYKITKKDQGIRLDQFIKNNLGNDFSAKQIKYSIEKGLCQVNGLIDYRPHYRCCKGDTIQLKLIQNITKDNNNKINIILEDEYFIAINKSTHISSQNAEALLNNSEKLLHRLDKPTSGVLLFAKNKRALEAGEQLFKHQLIHKTYHAVVQGSWKKEEGIISTQHGAKGTRRGLKIWGSVTNNGQLAVTEYKTLAKDEDISFIKFHPTTGRTHQIRCHAADGGHPIIGDNLYGLKLSGNNMATRLMLHASELKFKHPFHNKEIIIKTPLPTEFIDLLKKRKKFKEIVSLYSNAR